LLTPSLLDEPAARMTVSILLILFMSRML
jgi:hypothetical protein